MRLNAVALWLVSCIAWSLAVVAAPVPAVAPVSAGAPVDEATAAAEPLKVSWSKELKVSSLASVDEAIAQPLADPFDVILPDQSVRKLKTCKDLLAVSKVKFDLPAEHQSDVDWNAVTSNSIRCLALETLKGAKPASTSYLGWFHFTQADVAKLPATFAMSIAEHDDRAIAKAAKSCKPWGKYDRQLKLSVDGADDGKLTADGWAGRLTMYARGDLDGDGIEDLMFYRYAKLNEGESSNESLFIVTQTSPKACPKVIRTMP
jgi:hypothetical protein